jgi:hypothetical protein
MDVIDFNLGCAAEKGWAVERSESTLKIPGYNTGEQAQR